MAEVRNIDDYVGATVDGAVDTFSFSSGAANTAGTEYAVTAPNGDELVLRKSAQEDAEDRSATATVFRLDGQFVSGIAGDWQYVSGDLSGAPVEGTWIIRLTPSGSYPNVESSGVQWPQIDAGGLTLLAAMSWVYPDTYTTLWNAHIGSSTDYDEISLQPAGIRVSNGYYADPRHDANNAVYYVDASLIDDFPVLPSDPEFVSTTTVIGLSRGEPITE